jgi:hypothetical protein
MPITPLLRETYFAMIRKSAGSRMFQTLIARDGKHDRDILENGKLSCAAYVSWILHHFGFIKDPHATVNGTLKDMRASGWQRIRKPTPGCVLLWEGIRYPDGETHRHLGFFLGGTRAISNSALARVPVFHHWTFGRKGNRPIRRIKSMYSHPLLR